MSGLNNALLHKQKRASEVVAFAFHWLKTMDKATTSDEITLSKKTSRMIHGLKTNTEKTTNSFEYLQKFYEYMDKIIAKINNFNGDPSVFLEKLLWVNEIKPIVIFDVDDTLRDASHRMDIRHRIEAMKKERNEAESRDEKERLSLAIDKEWQNFFLAGFEDTPKQDVIDLCNFYYDSGFEVRIRTGASAVFFDKTVNYLADCGVKYHHLRMRKEGVKIPDYRLKPAWISKYDLGQNVFATYDDRMPLNENYQKKGVVNTYLVDKAFDAKKHMDEIKDEIIKQTAFFK